MQGKIAPSRGQKPRRLGMLPCFKQALARQGISSLPNSSRFAGLRFGAAAARRFCFITKQRLNRYGKGIGNPNERRQAQLCAARFNAAQMRLGQLGPVCQNPLCIPLHQGIAIPFSQISEEYPHHSQASAETIMSAEETAKRFLRAAHRCNYMKL